MAYITATTVASEIRAFSKEKILTNFHNQMVGSQFAQVGENIPQGAGNVVEWTRKIKLAKTASAIGVGSDITPKAFYTTKITAEVQKWADGIASEREIFLIAQHFKSWKDLAGDVGTQMAETLDYQIMKLLGTNGYRMRADADPTFEFNDVVAVDGDSTGLYFGLTTYAGADDAINGGYCTITGLDTAFLSRKSYCETRKISDWDLTGGTIEKMVSFTGALWPSQIKVGCTVHITVGTGIVATDVITTSVFALGIRQLQRHKGIRFTDALITKGMGLPHQETQNLPPGAGSGPYWVCIVDQDHIYDFMKDSNWAARANYHKDEWVNAEIDKWMGAKLFGTTQPWRETVDGTEAEVSGIVHPIHFLATDAYAITPVADPKAVGDFGTIVTIKEPEDFSDFIQYRSSMSWQTYGAWRSLNSLWNIVILAGSTL